MNIPNMEEISQSKIQHAILNNHAFATDDISHCILPALNHFYGITIWFFTNCDLLSVG